MGANSINLAGQTTLLELACIFKKAQLVVTTDSGPMHLACAVGTPVVALFGPTDPARTGPYGAGHTIIRADLPCSHYFLKDCLTIQCMKNITPELVFAVVEDRIKKGSRNY